MTRIFTSLRWRLEEVQAYRSNLADVNTMRVKHVSGLQGGFRLIATRPPGFSGSTIYIKPIQISYLTQASIYLIA